jgi:hypothetical protein
MTPISGEYFQQQLEAKNEALYFMNAELAKLKARVSAMECAMEEALEYFEDRYDTVDSEDGQPRPNEAMRLGRTIDDALGRLS